jgi:5-oxoprolinase (ATP-hydrolysing)
VERNYRIGMDIGGTFTDFVLASSDSELHLHKRLTTPSNPAEGALRGLKELVQKHDISLNHVDLIVHGTTLVTNAIIERRGAKTALLTTCGFKDTLEMGHEQRYDIYDLFLQFPEPIAPRHLRREVHERMSRDGLSLKFPDLDAVEAQVKSLLEEDIEALALSFLHAYINPEHEQVVAKHIRERFPGLAVSVSHEVNPEIREFERTNTTVCNAYVQPLMERYLDELLMALGEKGFGGHFLLMQSSGGSATVETARRFPIRFLESGPAGGARVTSYIGKAIDAPDLLAFDMGGTTAKACLIREGRPDTSPLMEAARVHRFKAGSGLPIKAPVVDMIEIGAGGGSVAHIDNLGLLKVGPRSAGADPGPACYAQGGEYPTVTDACLLLGYFDPGYFLGGTMSLDKDAALTVCSRLSKQLGLDFDATVWGVYQIVCESMARAARVHIIEKGQDPRRYALMAFGGAGPAHATRVARILGSPEVIVPRVSGVASALGFLVAPVSFEFSRSRPGELDHLDWGSVEKLYAELNTQALNVLGEAGISSDDVRLEMSADMRYKGQFHELEIPLESGAFNEAGGEQLAKNFKEAYAGLYHATLPGYRPMVINWHLRAYGPEPEVHLGAWESTDQKDGLKGSREAYFPEAGGWTTVPVYDRYALTQTTRLTGPLIVEERESTTIVNAADELTVDALGNLRIKIAVGGKEY